MRIKRVGLGKWEIEGIPELTFDSYWSARAYLLALKRWFYARRKSKNKYISTYLELLKMDIRKSYTSYYSICENDSLLDS